MLVLNLKCRTLSLMAEHQLGDKMAIMYVYTDCRLDVKTEPILYNRNQYLDIEEFKPNDSDNLLGFRPGQQLLSET